MRVSFGKIGTICVFAVTLTVLAFASVTVQAQMGGPGRPQMGMRPPVADDWSRNDNWRAYQRRFFGGVTMQPRRGESMASFRARVVQQCNRQWDRCVRQCNFGTRHPNQQQRCVSNCNNFLFECRAGW